jgi:hypothetical protein
MTYVISVELFGLAKPEKSILKAMFDFEGVNLVSIAPDGSLKVGIDKEEQRSNVPAEFRGRKVEIVHVGMVLGEKC